MLLDPGLKAVLRIHDILVWILIRLMDPNVDPSIFVINLPDCNKNNLKKKIFCLLLFEGTFTSFYKGKKSKISHKTVGIIFFLTVLLDDRRIRIRIHTSDLRIREA